MPADFRFKGHIESDSTKMYRSHEQIKKYIEDSKRILDSWKSQSQIWPPVQLPGIDDGQNVPARIQLFCKQQQLRRQTSSNSNLFSNAIANVSSSTLHTVSTDNVNIKNKSKLHSEKDDSVSNTKSLSYLTHTKKTPRTYEVTCTKLSQTLSPYDKSHEKKSNQLNTHIVENIGVESKQSTSSITSFIKQHLLYPQISQKTISTEQNRKSVKKELTQPQSTNKGKNLEQIKKTKYKSSAQNADSGAGMNFQKRKEVQITKVRENVSNQSTLSHRSIYTPLYKKNCDRKTIPKVPHTTKQSLESKVQKDVGKQKKFSNKPKHTTGGTKCKDSEDSRNRTSQCQRESKTRISTLKDTESKILSEDDIKKLLKQKTLLLSLPYRNEKISKISCNFGKESIHPLMQQDNLEIVIQRILPKILQLENLSILEKYERHRHKKDPHWFEACREWAKKCLEEIDSEMPNITSPRICRFIDVGLPSMHL